VWQSLQMRMFFMMWMGIQAGKLMIPNATASFSLW
jgi:hypothetical protein